VSAVPAPAVEQPPEGFWPTLVRLQGRLPLLQFAALGGVYTYLAIWHGFSNWSSAKEILVIASLAGLASAGQTLLILMGGFDLSISGFALGLVQVQTHGSFSGTAPDWLQHLTSPKTKTFGVIDIPPPVAIWIVVAVLMGVFIHRTPAGRMLLATGANPKAAEYSLISTRRVWTLAFAFSGIAAVLVGMLVCGFSGSVDSGIGDPYLFQSVVAVIVGGTVFGGPGDYTRTVIGALFLTFVYETLIANNQGPGVQNMVYGAAILVAVALYGRERRLRDRI
jgi:ribose transport system permease protein